MSKSKLTQSNTLAVFKNVKVLVFASILVAISVTGKLFSFNIGEYIRLGYENLPVVLSGIAFGPLLGFLVGVAADICGCFAVGYSINPLITLGMGALGLVAGLISLVFKYNLSLLSIIISDVAAHITGSIIIKTIGIAIYYGAKNGIVMLFLERTVNYLIIIALEIIILSVLLTNKQIKKELLKLRK